MALSPTTSTPTFIGSARALLISGTHLSQPQTHAACLAAMHAARAAGTKVVLDIDYRPVLWGLTSPGLGERRYVASDQVTQHLQSVLPLCDLSSAPKKRSTSPAAARDSLAALARMREMTGALIVMKRGPMGCVAYPGDIPARLG